MQMSILHLSDMDNLIYVQIEVAFYCFILICFLIFYTIILCIVLCKDYSHTIWEKDVSNTNCNSSKSAIRRGETTECFDSLAEEETSIYFKTFELVI